MGLSPAYPKHEWGVQNAKGSCEFEGQIMIRLLTGKLNRHVLRGGMGCRHKLLEEGMRDALRRILVRYLDGPRATSSAA